MTVLSRADASWSGTLIEGEGEVSAASSGAFSSLPVTWKARTEAHGSLTSPEELLAAAHAACFSMAFASNLTKAGTPPTRLDVSVEISFDKLEAWTVTSSTIIARGVVPGIDAEAFSAIAETTKVACPISRALNPDIALRVEATLLD